MADLTDPSWQNLMDVLADGVDAPGYSSPPRTGRRSGGHSIG